MKKKAKRGVASVATVIRLDAVAAAALEKLKGRVGGFRLAPAVRQWLVDAAAEAGEGKGTTVKIDFPPVGPSLDPTHVAKPAGDDWKDAWDDENERCSCGTLDCPEYDAARDLVVCPRCQGVSRAE